MAQIRIKCWDCRQMHDGRSLRCFSCALKFHTYKSIKNLRNRFFSKVQKTNSCWLWKACISRNGYGIFGIGDNNRNYAHRVSYFLHNGKIPKDRLILHSCDVKHCVNPKHLELGDHSKNIQDAWDRGLRRHYAKKVLVNR